MSTYSYTTLEVQNKCTGSIHLIYATQIVRTAVRSHKYTDCVRVINYDISNTVIVKFDVNLGSDTTALPVFGAVYTHLKNQSVFFRLSYFLS